MSTTRPSVRRSAALLAAILGPTLLPTTPALAAPVGITQQYEEQGAVGAFLAELPVSWSPSGSIVGSSITTTHLGPANSSVSSVFTAYADGGSSPTDPISLHARVVSQIDLAASFALARGTAYVALTDNLVVIDGPVAGALRFNWAFDGTARYFMDTNDPNTSALLSDQIFFYSNRNGGRLLFTPPVGAGSTQVLAQVLVNEVEGNVIPNPLQLWDAHDTAESLASLQVFTTETEVSRTEVVSTSARLLLPVPLSLGSVVPVIFGLEAGFSYRYNRLDSNPLYGVSDGDVSNTASLVSVEILNADGSEYIGNWSLRSEAGYQYPIVVRTAGGGPGTGGPTDPAPVPLPATGALLLGGLAGLAFTGTGRRRSA